MHIADLIQMPVARTRATSKRALLIGEIVDKINSERKALKFYEKDGKKIQYKPVTPQYIGIKLSPFKGQEGEGIIEYIIKRCNEAIILRDNGVIEYQGRTWQHEFFRSITINPSFVPQSYSHS